MSKFGDRLRSLRIEKGILQRELADYLNVSRVTITHYENGKRNPDQETLIKLAKYLDVSIDYLLGNSDIRNPYNDNENTKSNDKPQNQQNVNISSNNKEEQKQLPDSFDTPEEAVKFLLEQNVIMGFGGFDIDKLSDEEKVEFANELLHQLKLISYKYKK